MSTIYYRSVVKGSGAYLPPKIVHNTDLEIIMDTSHEWIFSRTGISQRHWVEEQVTSDLATEAAKEALKNASLSSLDVNLIVVATTTPDAIFPSVATIVQEKIGAYNAFAFDVQAVCSGFVYGLSVADQYIQTGHVKTALVIGADSMSRLLNPEDRTTRVLFGDGAGAFVLQGNELNSTLSNEEKSKKRGILSTHLYSDGRLKNLLFVDNGPGKTNPGHGYIQMQGREVFRHAVEKIGSSVVSALHHNNMTIDDINWFVPHQANSRIISGLCDRFNIPREKVIMTVSNHGNTSAASIPLAVDYGVSHSLIKQGDLVLIEALGGGLTWGSALIKW